MLPKWWPDKDLNLHLNDYESFALSVVLSGHKWRRPFYPGQLTHGLIFRIFISDFPGQRKNDQDTDNTGTSIVAGKTGIEPVT